MGAATLGAAIAECHAEAADFDCPVSQQVYGPTGSWNTSAVQSMQNLFRDAGSFSRIIRVAGWAGHEYGEHVLGRDELLGNLSAWQVGQVTI